MGNLHIMTPNELENIPDGTVVWQERKAYTNTAERLIPMVMYRGIIGNYYEYMYPDELRALDNIQMMFRYWNYKPTITTMESTPWVFHKEWQE